VGITTTPENSRSQFIDQQATPLLRQETLQAQNANIDTVGGATMTSEAFITSLQGALKKAHLA
ncbi:MAG TPA: FMN-binding protein, partial [Chloroflexota bacterium]